MYTTTDDQQVSGSGAPAADPFSVSVDDLAGPPDVAFDPRDWVRTDDPAPSGGVRRVLWRLTGGRYRPAPTADELRARALLDQVRRPFTGARTIAVVSTKGGVGKTTTTLNLGHALASTRGDRVVALDANPDAGSLGHRVARETALTAADLLALDRPITSYADIRPYTSQAASRLEVIASADDPVAATRMGRHDYRRLLDALRQQYNLVLADCGTGILDPATRGVVQSADHLVVVTNAGVDAARAVTYLLSWLREHGMADKVDRAVVVVNAVRPGRGPVDVGRVVDHFAQVVRDVVTIPWDDELANGAQAQLDWLAPATRRAYVGLAASLIDDVVARRGDDPTTGRGGRSDVAWAGQIAAGPPATGE